MPLEVHELGNPPAFPVGQQILSWEVLWTGHVPCPAKLLAIDMRQVARSNLTSMDWPAVWYVADDGTTIVNDDRRLVGQLSPLFHLPWLAFKIDAYGLNTPLVSESLNQDGIFEVGETWELRGRATPTASAARREAFDSLGIAGASAGFRRGHRQHHRGPNWVGLRPDGTSNT